jgi:U3 small nucleolar RNA-associated protein 14
MISERYDKKSSKYTTDSVPFPFKKKEDYERSIRTPLGRDFNSEKSHRDLTRPDILTTTGVRIDPIAYTKSNSNPNKDSGISNVRKF